MEERIHYLLDVYTSGTATTREEEELWERISKFSDDEVIRDHIRQLIQGYRGEEYPLVNWEKVYQKVLKRMHETPELPSRNRVRSLSWLAAAASVLLVSGLLYLFSKQGRQPAEPIPAVSSVYGSDIAPGKTKAILQAGNQQVVLNKEDTSFKLGGNLVYIKGGSLNIARKKPIPYILITPRGGQYKLTLSDGTTVWMNAASKLVYPSFFGKGKREVTLEGEAYFKVQMDASSPFIVRTNRQSIQVLGTEFNVDAYADETNIVTTLVTGSVRVNASGRSVNLKPGQQVQLDQKGEMSLNHDADIAQAIAWKNGYFRFDKADIQTIMLRLSRWYDVKVSYGGDLKQHYFGAIISRNNNISKVLNMLEATGDVQFKVSGNNVVVLP